MSRPETDIGALAAQSPQSVLAAVQAVRQGHIYDLGVQLGTETPRLPPEIVVPFTLKQFRTPESFSDPALLGNSFSLEVIGGSIHQSSHIDAFIHAQRNGCVFGNRRVQDLLTDKGWRAFGAETIPPIVSRGIVIDVARILGRSPVTDGYAITSQELQNAVQSQRLELKPNDTVLVRTGKIAQYATDRPAFEAGCPGISAAAARWLIEQGMTVFGLDATSADPHPVPDQQDTVHEELLVKRGIHIIENLYLED
jgi:kynurenine formamidase